MLMCHGINEESRILNRWLQRAFSFLPVLPTRSSRSSAPDLRGTRESPENGDRYYIKPRSISLWYFGMPHHETACGRALRIARDPRKSRGKCLSPGELGEKRFRSRSITVRDNGGIEALRGCSTWRTIKLARNGPRPCSTDELFSSFFFNPGTVTRGCR